MWSSTRPNLELAERKALLLVVDCVLLSVSLVSALLLWSYWDPARFSGVPIGSEPAWLFLPLLWIAAATLTGCYDLRLAAEATKVLRAVALTASLILFLYAIAYFAAPRDALPRSVIVAHVIASTFLLGIWRAAYAYSFRRPAFLRRVLVLGSGEPGHALVSLIQAEGKSLYSVVAMVDDHPVKAHQTVLGVPVFGPTAGAADVALKLDVADVVVAVTDRLKPETVNALLTCRERGIRVIPMTLLYESLTGRVSVKHVGDSWDIVLPYNHAQTRIAYSIVKRTTDVLIASMGLMLFLVLLPVLALAIKLDSQGPVFYRQVRVGKNGQPYSLLKLRTMENDAEPDGKAVWAVPGDIRVTRLGSFLRASMLDELPQLWSVLKNDMSMVGPRPERPELVEQLDAQIPYYRVRHAVRPGLTGWAFLHMGYTGSIAESLAKLEYDLYYIKHQSFWLDLQILLRSIARGATLRYAESRAKRQEAIRSVSR